MVNRYQFILPVIVLLDQLTKYWARETQGFSITSFFSLSLVKNTGAGFGILQGKTLLLIIFNIAALAILIYFYFSTTKTKISRTGLLLIISGAAGNLIDRIFLGYVTDFISFSFWPAFNIADSAITVGAAILGYCIIRDLCSKDKDPKNPAVP